MNTDGLRTFLLVSKLKNFTRVAEQLFIAQSTVTNRIAELEKELSAKLLRRDTRNVALTEQGKAFCEYARRIVEMEDACIAAIKGGKMVIKTLHIRNVRASMVGKTIVVTGNGIMQGTSEPPLPEGLMRYTLVLGDNDGRQQVVLFQATPVVPSTDCKDGNCALR